MNFKAELFAALMRTGIGLLCLFAFLYSMPSQKLTPIMAMLSILMIVQGSYSAWRVGLQEHGLKPYARFAVYFSGFGTLLAIGLWPILGR